MSSPTLTLDTHTKLSDRGLIHTTNSQGKKKKEEEEGFCSIGLVIGAGGVVRNNFLPFPTIFPELPFPKNRIPTHYDSKNYIEYLGFTPIQSLIIFNDYRIRKNLTGGLINPFTLLIEVKNHISKCSKTDILSNRPALCEIGGDNNNNNSCAKFIWCEKFGLMDDIIEDIDILLKNTKENEQEMDRYLASFKGAKKVEDLLFTDFIIEILDRRFTKLFTLERNARRFLREDKNGLEF